MSNPLCECGHRRGDHSIATSWPHNPRSGLCMFFDRCGCRVFLEAEEKRATWRIIEGDSGCVCQPNYDDPECPEHGPLPEWVEPSEEAEYRAFARAVSRVRTEMFDRIVGFEAKRSGEAA